MISYISDEDEDNDLNPFEISGPDIYDKDDERIRLLEEELEWLKFWWNNKQW